MAASHTSSIKLAKCQLAPINSLRVTKLPETASIDINVCRGTQIQLLWKIEQFVSKPEKGSPTYYWGAATDHRQTCQTSAQLLYTCVQLSETALRVKTPLSQSCTSPHHCHLVFFLS